MNLSGSFRTLQGQVGDWCIWFGADDAAIVAENISPKLYEPALRLFAN